MLSDLIHLIHGHIDFLQARRLLLGRGGDLDHQGADVVDLGGDGLEGRAGLADQAHAVLDLGAGAVDQGLDLLGGLGRTLSQGPDFRGDDRKAATALARPRRLNPGVQSQKIGLEGDLVDDADDLADLTRAVFDLLHGFDGVHHDGA